MGYIIIKYMDISGEGDYKVIMGEKISVEEGEHIFHPKEIQGYRNIPYPEPPIKKPDPCDGDWEPPYREPIPFGSQRIAIDQFTRLGYVEFYYEKVII